MVVVQRIASAEEADIEGINYLLQEQSPGARHITTKDLREALQNQNYRLFGAFEERKFIGMGSVFYQRNLARWIAEIHDVVVVEAHRGHGIGQELVKTLLEDARTFAREKDVRIKLYLTSRPSRIAANNLYLKLGFTQVAHATGGWGTNLYKMMLAP